MRYLLLTFFIFSTTIIYSQEDHFIIEIEPFSPDVNQMIRMMEANTAEPFEAVDMDGITQKFGDHLGEFMMLWFWNIEDELSIGQIDGLNLMHQIYADQLTILSFAYDNRASVAAFIQNKSVDFPIIPNSIRIGELLYGSELGQGRLFLINQNGIVQKAIPRQFFIDNENSFNQLRTFISELINTHAK